MNYTFTFLTEVELHNAKITLDELISEVAQTEQVHKDAKVEICKDSKSFLYYKKERIERIKNDIEFTKAVISIDPSHCKKHNIDFERFNKCRTHHDESMGKIDPQYKLS